MGCEVIAFLLYFNSNCAGAHEGVDCGMNEQDLNECLWQEIVARAGKQFETHKGVPFSYHIKEDRSGETSGVLVIDGKLKKLTRSTVLLAYHRTREVQEARGCVSKPGKIGVYGDVWLYPVFLDIGVCTKTKDEKVTDLTQRAADVADVADVTFAANTAADGRMDQGVQKICSHCGYTTIEDFDFCPKCGKKF